jgi:pimeloyl-ACP methyl ester carboxylesterase
MLAEPGKGGLNSLPRRWARSGGEGARKQVMSKDIVMLHGANAGGWCFDTFRAVFEGQGFTCHAPDLIGHGKNRANAAEVLKGVSIAGYRAEMADFVGGFASPPILLGHSMGAVIAQSLAAEGLASALVLAAPAPHAGILPRTALEKKLGRDLMSIGDLREKVLDPIFDLAKIYTLNRLPESEQRAVFDRFGPESGRALFELFVWMFDETGATVVDTEAVRCPVLCLSGTDDRIVSLETARETAKAYQGAPFWALEGRGHMFLLEPGAEGIARRIADWFPV